MLSLTLIVILSYFMYVSESSHCISQIVNCVCSNTAIIRMEVQTGLKDLLERGNCNIQKPLDCEDLYNQGYRQNKVYKIYPDGKTGFDVYCDMKMDEGGWTVIQRRFNGKTDFYRTWKEYKAGFGKRSEEYWLVFLTGYILNVTGYNGTAGLSVTDEE